VGAAAAAGPWPALRVLSTRIALFPNFPPGTPEEEKKNRKKYETGV